MNYSLILKSDYIILAVPLLVMIAGLINKNKTLFALLGFQLACNIVAYILCSNVTNNIFCYQINIVGSVILVSLFLNKKFIWLSVLPVIALFFDKPDLGFNSFSWCIGSFVIIIICVVHLFKGVDEKFFFLCGLIIYYAGSLKIFDVLHTMTILSPHDVADYWALSTKLYLVMCVFFVFGFNYGKKISVIEIAFITFFIAAIFSFIHKFDDITFTTVLILFLVAALITFVVFAYGKIKNNVELAERARATEELLERVLGEKVNVQERPNIHFNEKEKEYIRLCAEGNIRKEVAIHMGVSTRTVDNYKNSVLEKTNTRSVAEAIKFITEHKLG